MSRYHKFLERHNFDAHFKLNLCCGVDDFYRPAMQHIHFYNGYAYATDAHILVKAKIADVSDFTDEEIAMLNDHSISARAFARVIRHRFVRVTPDGFVFQDDDVVQTYRTFPHIVNEEGRRVITDPDKVNAGLIKPESAGYKIPDFEKVLAMPEQHADVPAIGLNVEELQQLTTALDLEYVSLHFYGMNKTIVVKDNGKEFKPRDIMAIIMPCLVKDENL